MPITEAVFVSAEEKPLSFDDFGPAPENERQRNARRHLAVSETNSQSSSEYTPSSEPRRRTTSGSVMEELVLVMEEPIMEPKPNPVVDETEDFWASPAKSKKERKLKRRAAVPIEPEP